MRSPEGVGVGRAAVFLALLPRLRAAFLVAAATLLLWPDMDLGTMPLPAWVTDGVGAFLLVVVVLAAIFLGETVRKVRLTAVGMGMVGVLIILWPRLSAFTGGDDIEPLLAMGALIYGAIEAGALGIGAGPRFGARTLIVSGLVSMSAGLAVVAALPASAPVAGIATLTVLVGLAGPLVAPPVTAVLLSSVPGPLAGTASDVFNASRQVGGALAVDLFGALLAQAPSFMAGMRISLLLAAGVALVTAAMGMRLQPSGSPESLATP